MLNRDPSRILYLSGNALETSLQTENCVPIKQWKGESDDTELLDIIPFLECKLCQKFDLEIHLGVLVMGRLSLLHDFVLL